MTSRFQIGILVLLFNWSAFTAFGPQLVGGVEASIRFPSIFIFSEYRKHLTDQFCTATKSGERQFITAAHCVLDIGDKRWFFPNTAKPGSFYYYSFSKNLSTPENVYALKIKKVFIHPLLQNCINKAKYSPALCHSRTLPTPDVAIVEVEPGEGPFFEAPSMPLDFSPNRPGDEIILTGYGSTMDGDTSPPRLKYGHSKVASQQELLKAVEGTSAAEMGFTEAGFYFGTLGPLLKKELPNLGSGDSGGPVIKEFPDRIVGINSSAVCYDWSPSDCEVTTNNFFARIDGQAKIPLDHWLDSITSGQVPPEKVER